MTAEQRERAHCEAVLRQICERAQLNLMEARWEECIDLLVAERAAARSERSNLLRDVARGADALERLAQIAEGWRQP